MDATSLFFVIAAVAIIIMLAVWALSGAKPDTHAGAVDHHSSAGQAITDAVKEVTQTIEGNPLSTAEIEAEIAATAREVRPEPAPAEAEAGKPRIAAAVGAPDNLRQIKGVGPKLNTLLGELGICRFDQIAAWSDADIAEVDPYLGTFKGRIVRDNWIEQARFLAASDIAGFEAKFGKL